MGPVENISPFGLAFLPNVDRHGNEILLVAVAACFALPSPGRVHEGALEVHAEQPPPHFDDVYWDEPGKSALRYEGQSAYTRLGTDIHLSGSAHAPGGRPVAQMEVELAVGPCRAAAHVVGDRIWVNTAGTFGASPPVPFVSLPLVWTRAFGGGEPEAGGRGYEPRNPIGVGIYESIEAASNAPLPNLEHPGERIHDPAQRVTPVGFGPIGRHWHPRASFAGTYDERWQRERAPLWPEDFDERFFFAAAPGMSAVPHLRGGEMVMMSGVHPEGGLGFRLPVPRLVCKSGLASGVERVAMRFDALILEPDEGSLTMIYRASIRVGRSGGLHRYSIVRALEPWEAMPERVFSSVGGQA